MNKHPYLFLILCLSMLLVTSCTSPTEDPAEVIDEVSVQDPPIEQLTPPPAQPVLLPQINLPESYQPDPRINEILAGMSDEEKIGQLILSGIEGTSGTDEACNFISLLKPGGVFFMPGNVQDPDQLRQLSISLQECADSAEITPLLLSLDHEGENRYLFNSGITNFPSQISIGATGEPESAYQVAQAAGSELAYSGVNLVLGPVADVYSNLDNRLFSDRTYGSDPRQVASYAAQAVQGYMQAGIIPTLKHFPGHGGSETFYATKVLPVDNVDAETLSSTYIPPFLAGIEAGLPVILVSHVIYPNISGSYKPASESPKIINLLRDQVNFDGVLMSDAILSAEGITDEEGNVPKAALEVFKAGVDLLLIPESGQAIETRDFFLRALEDGQLTQERVNEAVRRILNLKSHYGIGTSSIEDIPSPDWIQNSAIAAEIGRNSLALFRDEDSLLPIPEQIEKILVIGPDDSWEFYSELETRLENTGREVDVVNYSPPWDGTIKEREYVQTLPKKAEKYDMTIFFTWQAHLDAVAQDRWQANLGKKLSRLDQPVIIVALNNPTDIYEFPKIGTYLAAHGSTPGQLEAVIDTLLGDWEPSGVIPLPQIY